MDKQAVYNIAFGMDESPNEDRFINGMKGNFKSFGLFDVAKIDVLHSVEEIDAAVKANSYDVIITQEQIGSSPIGSGSLKKWLEIQPDLHVMIIVKQSKKGGKKLGSLFLTGQYDCIYNSDFREGRIIADLIVKGRTKEEAFEYYGLENNADVMEKLNEEHENQNKAVVSPAEEPTPEPVNFSDIINDTDMQNENIPEEDDEESEYQETEVSEEIESENEEVDHAMQDELMEDMNKMFNEPSHENYYENNAPSQPSSMKYEVSAGLKQFDISASSVASSSGYVVSVLTDTAIVIEIPDAHFKSQNNAVPGMPVNLITPGMSLK